MRTFCTFLRPLCTCVYCVHVYIVYMFTCICVHVYVVCKCILCTCVRYVHVYVHLCTCVCCVHVFIVCMSTFCTCAPCTFTPVRSTSPTCLAVVYPLLKNKRSWVKSNSDHCSCNLEKYPCTNLLDGEWVYFGCVLYVHMVGTCLRCLHVFHTHHNFN